MTCPSATAPHSSEQLHVCVQRAAPNSGPESSRQPGSHAKQTKVIPANSASASHSEDKPANKPEKANTNTSIYVTGLPDDATTEEVAEEFQRCGIIREDADRQLRIKLYRCDLL
jgi:HIV Tat-specific factor 1